MTDSNSSTKKDWLYFAISAGATTFLLCCYPAWFWLGLPFTLTYLTKAFKAL
ncbi:MAG: hypothetical protein IPM34_10545 [Saprospiraceae bacterium]|nr:hypothetical protein [Saprospiraceae bacterium]